MPKTKLQNIIFTIIMAVTIVYGMIVYNVALNTGGVSNATFLLALHELPIIVPIAFPLEFFVVERLATRLAFSFMRPTGAPHFLHPVLPPAGRCRLKNGRTVVQYARFYLCSAKS